MGRRPGCVAAGPQGRTNVPAGRGGGHSPPGFALMRVMDVRAPMAPRDS
jgi:hypothetical protein